MRLCCWGFTLWIGRVLLVLFAVAGTASAADVVIDVSTAAADTLRIPKGFSGFNAPQLRNAAEYDDPALMAAVARLKPGWFRFPAGAASDAYDWSTGQLRSDWMTAFAGIPTHYDLLANAEQLTRAKGGVLLSGFTAFTNAFGARSTVVVNTATDTNPGSARNMALAAQAGRLPVVAWELGNEPFFFVPTLYASPTAYADAMQRVYSDIASVTPGAVVTVPFAGQFPGLAIDYRAWDSELAAYPSRFWNGVATHIYPVVDPTLTSTQIRPFLNGVLAHGSTEYVDSYLRPLVGADTPIYITEFNCTVWRTVTFQSSIYNGVFLAEYIARMSAHPNVKRVGVHALYMGRSYLSGMIQAGRDFETLLTTRVYPSSVNTAGWPFNFYLTAPSLALAVANEAINGSSSLWRTTVTGGFEVPISGYDGRPIPAVYAQAYKGDNGKRYLVITNKSDIPQTALVRMNGADVSGPFTVASVSSADPDAANTADTPDNVQITTATGVSQLFIPGYSVVRVEW